MRLGMADLVGEREHAEVMEEAVAPQPFAQAPARRVDCVGYDGEGIALGERLDGVADPRDGVRHHFELHLLDARGDIGQDRLGKLAAEPAEQHREPLADGPRDVLIVPDLVERGLGHVVGDVDDIGRYRRVVGEGIAHQRPARLALRGAVRPRPASARPIRRG